MFYVGFICVVNILREAMLLLVGRGNWELACHEVIPYYFELKRGGPRGRPVYEHLVSHTHGEW